MGPAKCVLVTGGAGFVGSNVVRALDDGNTRIIVLDDLSTGCVENLPPSPYVFFVQDSVCNHDVLFPLVAQVDYVIHMATVDIASSMLDPAKDFWVNVGGTLNVLSAAREHKKRVLFTSAASVYGNPRHLPAHEDDAPRVLSPYSASKLAAEHYCTAFYESYGVETVVVRYSNVYGPRQHPHRGVVAKFMQAISDGRMMEVHGDGEQTRDFTYVDDVVEATLLAATHPRAVGQTVNVGTGRETTVNALAQIIGDVSEMSPMVVYTSPRAIDSIRRRAVDVDRARHVLGWAPRTALRVGLQLTWEWFKTKTA